MPENMTEFEKESWEKSQKETPEKCDWYLEGWCCQDLSSGKKKYCNNGHPSTEKKDEKWEGCMIFEKGN